LFGRAGWKPPIVRTVATENTGVDELARQIALYREHFEKAHDRPARELAYWKEWLLRLLERRLVERVLDKRISDAQFEELAAQVAARKKDPYAAVNEILSRAGIS
jgi:LAO/AO transport system kinase